MTLTGYDIAGVNGSGIITTALKGAFTIVKATEGVTFNDTLHDTFCSKLRAAGKLVGHYHYAHPANNVTTEADHFITRAAPRPGETMWLDFEPYNQGTNEATWPEWIIAFCSRVKARTGAACGVYLNDWFANHVLANATTAQATALRQIPFWKAGRNNAYVSDPSVGAGDLHGWQVLTCWQWKGTTIDEDIFYGTAATWRELAVPDPNAPTEEAELMAITVKNPITGEDWDLPRALWSMWTYSINAARDSGAALAIAKAHAADALTPEEIEAAAAKGAQAALDAEIDSATVNLNVTQPGA